jgi:hypothetical protein
MAVVVVATHLFLEEDGHALADLAGTEGALVAATQHEEVDQRGRVVEDQESLVGEPATGRGRHVVRLLQRFVLRHAGQRRRAGGGGRGRVDQLEGDEGLDAVVGRPVLDLHHPTLLLGPERGEGLPGGRRVQDLAEPLHVERMALPKVHHFVVHLCHASRTWGEQRSTTAGGGKRGAAPEVCRPALPGYPVR